GHPSGLSFSQLYRREARRRQSRHRYVYWGDNPGSMDSFTDGSSCLEGSGAGLILKGTKFTYALRFEFKASNNEVEYEALVVGLRIAEHMGVQNLKAKVDSRLVANQINGSYVGPVACTPNQDLWLQKKSGPDTTGQQCTRMHEKLLENVTIAKSTDLFGLLGEVISDNGKQFRDNTFKDWYGKLSIKQRFALVKHPQTNGQVERANRSLGKGIKARLGEVNKNWVEEVPHVLWAHRTTIKTNQAANAEALLLNLDVIEGELEKAAIQEEKSKAKMEKYYNAKAAIQEEKSKAKMEKYYNAKVHNTIFKPGDFLYRHNKASHAKDRGKLGPRGEGPYEVVGALGKGAYKFRNGSGDTLSQT
nr:hypothetical protein [Tanacetum cinerariifolium]